MLKTYDTLKAITGEATAKEIIIFLVTNFNWYITTDEIQTIGLNF